MPSNKVIIKVYDQIKLKSTDFMRDLIINLLLIIYGL